MSPLFTFSVGCSIFSSVASGDVDGVSIKKVQLSVVMFSIADTFSVCRV